MAYNYTKTQAWLLKTCKALGITPVEHLREYGANYPQAEINAIAELLSEWEKRQIVAAHRKYQNDSLELAQQSTDPTWIKHHTDHARGMREIADRWAKTLSPQKESTKDEMIQEAATIIKALIGAPPPRTWRKWPNVHKRAMQWLDKEGKREET